MSRHDFPDTMFVPYRSEAFAEDLVGYDRTPQPRPQPGWTPPMALLAGLLAIVAAWLMR